MDELQSNLGEEWKVVLLCYEWGSSKGGLSTFNRQLAVHLAEWFDIKVFCFLPEGSERDKNDAVKHNVVLVEADPIPGESDPLQRLQRWPSQQPSPDVIISHGRKFGYAAHFIKAMFPRCKWVHFVHVNYEEKGKYEIGDKEIRANNEKDSEELSWCTRADVVVAVGPRLLDKYCRSLSSKKVKVFYPGLSSEFLNLSPKTYESKVFHVYIFGHCSLANFELKGVDLVANAVGKLGKSYSVHVVGVPEDDEENIFQHTLKETAITKYQLYVEEYCNNRDELKTKISKADLVVMPSRAEAFGLIGLEALSACVPLLVSADSGFGMTLANLHFSQICVVESDDSEDWAKRIKSVKESERSKRIEEINYIKTQYEEKYKWKNACSVIIEKTDIFRFRYVFSLVTRYMKNLLLCISIGVLPHYEGEGKRFVLHLS